ncbi:AlpA family phage regulatory protein [Pseudomonas cannabina]|uniref:AlpA family phage regulatory protein n=1 Tax=Pseudomonas cannabina TaxID=86840 RepID=UPI000943CF8F|nr:AlpA family phage regulatory protein [Pseudomonas cannabina]
MWGQQLGFRINQRLPKSGIYFLINNGSFPRPVPLGIRAVGWIEAEVSAWLSHKCEKRLTQAVR